MRKSAIILLLGILALGSRAATAGCHDKATCCDRCGRQGPCVETVCQVQCGTKKETKTCWCVECQDFCPLMPGCHDKCSDCPPTPQCGHPRTIKKLVKKEYQVDVPVYKCVVQHLCTDCCNGGTSNVIAPSPTPAPAAPVKPTAPLPPPPQAKN